MADVQLENGYTRIADELLEALSRANLRSLHLRAMLAIMRLTYGYQQAERAFGAALVTKVMGLDNKSRSRVRAIMRDLERWNLIRRSKVENGNTPTVSVVKDFEQWQVPPARKEDAARTDTRPIDVPGTGVGPVPAPPGDPAHRRTGGPAYRRPPSKEILTENSRERAPSFAECFPEGLFADFVPSPPDFYAGLAAGHANPLGRDLEPLQVAEWHAWQHCVRGLNETKPRGMAAAIKNRWKYLNRFDDDELAKSKKWCEEIRWARRAPEIMAREPEKRRDFDESAVQVGMI